MDFSQSGQAIQREKEIFQKIICNNLCPHEK